MVFGASRDHMSISASASWFVFVCFNSHFWHIAAMWNVQDFVKEIQDIQNLAAIRQSAEIETSLVSQLKQRVVHHTAWSPGSLCSLMKAVQESEFSKENKDSLLLALDGLACGTMQTAAASKLAVRPPSVFKIENYISKKDWQILDGPCSWDATVCLAKRLRSLGMTTLREEVKKVCTALWTCMQIKKNQMMPAYEAIYQTSQNIHDAFLQLIPSTAGSGITHYPEHPAQLGDAFLQAAYVDDEPEPRQLPGFESLVANHTPIRTTSSLLKGKIKESETDRKLVKMAQMLVEKVAHETSSSNNCLGMLQKMKPKQLAQPEKPGLQLLTGSAGSAPGEVSLPLTDEKQSKLEEQPEQKPSLLHMPAETASMPVVAASAKIVEPESAKIVEPTNVGKSLEDYEQEAFDALVKKRPAASKVCKRPASKQPLPEKSSKIAKIALAPNESKKKAGNSKSKLLLGCIRCRGNINGCSSCQSESFQGLRLHGRAAWSKWYNDRKLKGL